MTDAEFDREQQDAWDVAQYVKSLRVPQPTGLRLLARKVKEFFERLYAVFTAYR